MSRLTFLGAAGTVTGSKYLVEANNKRLLVDCGLFQGGKALRQRNWERPVADPSSIDWVVLTHAHIDHTGYVPRLVSEGFRGPVLANATTRALCSLLLPDSAHLMEEDTRHAAEHGYSSHKPPLPLYTQDEALAALNRFSEIPRRGEHRISPEFLIRTHDAGHILGATSIELVITEGGKSTTVLFSGDLGRYSQPILPDPAVPPRADIVLCESTYGDRDHPSVPPPEEALAEVINRVSKRGGVIVVPAFAVDRTQLLMYYIRMLEDANRIPSLPVYIDSPMAISVTELYRRTHEDHDAAFTAEELKGTPLDARNLHIMKTSDESKQINDVKTPAIIISASGMATGGRVMHHLAQRLPDARNCILLCGFQAEGSGGRALEEGTTIFRTLGEQIPVRAEVVNLRQFSAHAGRGELLRWLSGLPQGSAQPGGAGGPRQVYMVHGEPAAALSLQQAVQSQFHWPTSVAQYRQSVEL